MILNGKSICCIINGWFGDMPILGNHHFGWSTKHPNEPQLGSSENAAPGRWFCGNSMAKLVRGWHWEGGFLGFNQQKWWYHVDIVGASWNNGISSQPWLNIGSIYTSMSPLHPHSPSIFCWLNHRFCLPSSPTIQFFCGQKPLEFRNQR